MKRTIKVPAKQYREFAVEIGRAILPPVDDGSASIGDARPRYPMSFSSEAPVRRFDWWEGQEYDEVLSHDESDIDLSRLVDGQLPFLRSHTRQIILGSVRDVNLKSKKMRGDALFSSIQDGQDGKTLVDEGDVKTVSFGYEITGIRVVEPKKKGGVPTYRCSWMPFEVSLEPIAADLSVGIGRGMDSGQRDAMRQQPCIAFEVEEDPAPAGDKSANTITTPNEGERSMSIPAGAVTPTPTEPARAVAAGQPEIAVGRDFAAETRELMELAAANAPLIPEDKSPIQRAQDWMTRGLTPAQATAEILTLVRSKQTAARQVPGSEGLDLKPKERQEYSFARAVGVNLSMKEGQRVAACLELDVHQDLARNSAGGDHGGIKVPFRFKRSEADRAEYERAMAARGIFGFRTLGTDQATGGQTLVGTTLMPDMIDILRNSAMLLQAGARLYTGLRDSITFMKKTSGPTIGWRAEHVGSDISKTQALYTSVSATPKTLMGAIKYPRQLAVQASIDFETDIRNDLGLGHGIALDAGGLSGTGAANDPTGLFVATTIPTVPFGGAPTNPKLVQMTTKLAKSNAITGSLSFMCEPGVAGYLMSKPVETGAPLMIWQGRHDNGTMCGYSARSTNNVPDNLGDGLDEKGIAFGNWNDIAVLLWGNELELVVDPYTSAGDGQIVITSFSMGNVVILRDESFCIGTGVTIPA